MNPLPESNGKAIMILVFLLSIATWETHAMSARKESPVSGSSDPNRSSIQQKGVTGKVTDMNGRPVEGASIEARPTGQTVTQLPEIWILTNKEGQYHWPLPPGTYQLTASAKGFRPSALPVEVTYGRPAVLNFTLTPR